MGTLSCAGHNIRTKSADKKVMLVLKGGLVIDTLNNQSYWLFIYGSKAAAMNIKMPSLVNLAKTFNVR